MNYFKLFSAVCLVLWGFTLNAQHANSISIRSFNENIFETKSVSDSSGNRIIASQWTNGTGQGQSSSNVFIEKYNANGNMIFGISTLYQGSSSATLADLAIDTNNNVFVLINYRSAQAELANATFPGSPDNEDDFFLAKIGPLGSVLWITGPESDQFLDHKDRKAKSLSINEENKLIITGSHHVNFSVGGADVTGVQSDSADSKFDYPMNFVLKLDNDGNGIWAQSFNLVNFESVSGYHGVQDAHQAKDGSIYTYLDLADAVVLYDDTINPVADTNKFTKAILKTDQNFQNPQVLTMTSTNDFQFRVRDFILNKCGEPIVLGEFSENITIGNESLSSTKGKTDVFVAKVNHNNQIQWLKNFGSTEADDAVGLDVNDQNEIFFGMQYWGEYDYGNNTYTPQGQDVALFKLDTTGNFVWQSHSTGSGSINLRDLDVMDDNNVSWTLKIHGSKMLSGAPIQATAKLVLSIWRDDNYSGEPVECSNDTFVGKGRDLTENRLNVYPNPAESFVNIEKDKTDSHIQILNVQGQVVWTEKSNSKKSKVDINDLTPGMYFILVEGDEQSAQKLIVE
ncbi:T9SS type A sorting domain-containing protein [Salibacter halophilus]|nr:T9SS type A sorting domain-containing protein [Salibacter halophilus]